MKRPAPGLAAAATGVVLLLVSAQAHASGWEKFGLALVITALGLLAAKAGLEVALEVVTYRYALRLPWDRAWRLALASSAAATLVLFAGAATLGVSLDPREPVRLILSAAIALAAEIGIAWWLEREARPGWRLPTMAALANLVAWTILVGLVWVGRGALVQMVDLMAG